MSTGKRRKPARPWSDDLVAEILHANTSMECAALGIPGFDSLRELTGAWEKAKTGYAIAVSERYPVTRKRARLRRLASRILAAPIDWKATAEARRREPVVVASGDSAPAAGPRVSSWTPHAEHATASTPRRGADNVIDLMEALKKSIARPGRAGGGRPLMIEPPRRRYGGRGEP
jgi:hypothetical protein